MDKLDRVRRIAYLNTELDRLMKEADRFEAQLAGETRPLHCSLYQKRAEKALERACEIEAQLKQLGA